MPAKLAARASPTRSIITRFCLTRSRASAVQTSAPNAGNSNTATVRANVYLEVFSRGNQSEGPAGYADIYTMKKDGTKVKPLVEGVGSAYVEDVSPQGHTLIFRRDRGLWVKAAGLAAAALIGFIVSWTQLVDMGPASTSTLSTTTSFDVAEDLSW